MTSHCLFHPREIAFCGFSGSGKTTLISRLLSELAHRYSIGYVKHDTHHFEMDRAGKDTFEARLHGAGTVFINDAEHWAIQANGTPPGEVLRAIYAPLDMVLVEGYKESSLRKILVIDEQNLILEPARLAKISSVILYVGIPKSHPALPGTYCQRDDISSIKRLVLTTLGLEKD